MLNLRKYHPCVDKVKWQQLDEELYRAKERTQQAERRGTRREPYNAKEAEEGHQSRPR